MGIKDEITRITLDSLMGIRVGVGKARNAEFTAYINDLIAAIEGGIDVNAIQWPMLTDRVKQGVIAALTAKTDIGVEGGVAWNFVTAGANYGREKETGLTLNIEMEFMSAGAPDLQAVKSLSIDDLKKLQTLINAEA